MDIILLIITLSGYTCFTTDDGYKYCEGEHPYEYKHKDKDRWVCFTDDDGIEWCQ